ncbi:MAG: ChbG/HpnK family deacetylase [Alphaproteobacteria bacterium]|nr:ChbG/HpnK family deacetylase [Alphaproteobacteria bacterium]
MVNLIFNADDFGISKGVNEAIFKAHTQGVLNSTSIMITLKHVPEALELAKQMPNLNIGLHANLTNENSVLSKDEIPLLVDDNGKFRHGFVNLAVLSVLHPKELKNQAKKEIRAQIEKAENSGIKLTHLDSHRHIHMIPSIFKACMELAEEYNIPRLRFVNENPITTIKQTSSKEWLTDGGLIKNLVLISCAIVNKVLFNFKSDTYFYSIINTCKISRDKLNSYKVPGSYKAVEIGIHPGLPEIDKQNMADVFDDNILKEYRQKELETLLDKTVIQEFV